MSINICYGALMDKSDREKIIIEAALKVFSRKGYADTRMADIAREADMSYGLVYHYFENKEKLFDAIVEEWWTGFYNELEVLKKRPAPTDEKLIGIIRYLLNVYKSTPNQISIFVTEVSRGFVYHAHTRGRDKFNRLFALCQEIIMEGQTKGFLRNDIQAHYLTYVFLGAIDSFLSVMILGDETLTPGREKRIIDGIIQVFLHGAATG
jgi:TetR/AcrR family transcriptional regulator, fatty acid metabolism regulator protein